MYYVVYGFLFVLSLLPLRVLYLFSDFVYIIVYYIAGYRKKIVMQNLHTAFPEKTEEERERIARKFYRNFTDTLVETIKLVSADEKFLQKHFKGDTQLLSDLYKQGVSCQVHLGHNFNWEMGNLWLGSRSQYVILAVYMPLTNKIFDRIFRKIRSKTGTILLPATSMKQAILPYRGSQYLLGLVADQNPGVPANAYWFDFFGVPTPFLKGPEKGAKVNNTAVVFSNITKEKRGHYTGHLTLATTKPNEMKEGELTRIYVRFLENVIRQHPEMWLWSHRRWKHEWKVEYGEVGKEE